MSIEFTYTQEEVDTLCKEFYAKGAADMEKSKQIIIDTLLREIEQIRADVIDDFVKEMRKYWGGLKAMEEIEHIANKLKEQGNE